MTASKIRELLTTIDQDQIREDLTKLVDLSENPIFLKGISNQAEECPPVTDFKVIRDYEEAQKRMTDQEMWDLPEPWPYQYFPDIVESENGRLMYCNGITTEKLKQIDLYCDRFKFIIENYISSIIKTKWKQYEIDFLIKDDFIRESLLLEYNSTFMYLIIFCTYGGFAVSPILCRFYEAFLTGGAPCSWVGPLPEDGGDPKDCLQILYRGPVADPSLIVG